MVMKRTIYLLAKAGIAFPAEERLAAEILRLE
jgi:hypothetical protein